MSSQPVPEGYAPSERTGPFFDLIGPIHVKAADGQVALGLRVEQKHCNARGFAHAAVFAALLDVVMGRSCGLALGGGAHLVTVKLDLDYLSSAHEGQWLEATARVSRAGKRLAFAGGTVTADGSAVATATAIFAVTS